MPVIPTTSEDKAGRSRPGVSSRSMIPYLKISKGPGGVTQW